MARRIEYLSPLQKKRLKKSLQLAKNEDVFTLTELEGFLHALVITPDLVKPSEWLPIVFGYDDPDIDDDVDMKEFFFPFFDAYNAYERARTKSKLRFPFNVEAPSQEMIKAISWWCSGFWEALRLRPEIWFLDRDIEDVTIQDLPEPERTITVSTNTIWLLAYPGEIVKGSDTEKDMEISKVAEKLSLLIIHLPKAVRDIQSYANNLWQQKLREMRQGVFDLNPEKKKVGRNDPCPCGSGKKYKKCCGKN